ncbi:MAG: hypothetical protein M3281_10275 [Chloroflexota bacterium]|nr:hypothetical protein [Chloroflexota bacterium]
MLLAEAACSLEEATDLYARRVAAAERALGPSAYEEYLGHFWGVLGTGPCIRARLGLA